MSPIFFDYIIIGASFKESYVRHLGMPVEGKLIHEFEGIDVGNWIRVQLIFIDVIGGFTDLSNVD